MSYLTENNEDFVAEMDYWMNNISVKDKIILQYLLDKTLFEFILLNYDENYSIPYFRDETCIIHYPED